MPNWNFRELYYGVCEDVRDVSLTTLAKRWSNEVLDDVMTRESWSFAKREGHLLTTANTMFYSLPSHWDNISDFRQKDALRNMERMSGAQFHARIVKPTATGEPYWAIYNGIVGYYQTPESLIGLTSTSASDTGSVTVTGMSGGWEQSESVTLTGLTIAYTTKRYSRVISVVAGSAVTGTISVTDDASRALASIAAAGTTATISSQPASLISCSSSSTTDDFTTDAGQYLRIRGYSGDDVFLEETVELDGTTAALSTNYYNRIEEIGKYETSTGTITCTSNGGNKTVVKIAPNQLKAEHIEVGFYSVPNAAYDIEVRYSAQPKKMIEDHDSFHPIPTKYFNVLKDGVFVKAWNYLKYPNKSAEAKQSYEFGLKTMWQDDCRRVSTHTRIRSRDEGRVLFNIPRNAD